MHFCSIFKLASCESESLFLLDLIYSFKTSSNKESIPFLSSLAETNLKIAFNSLA